MGCCGNNRRPLPVENNEVPQVSYTPPAPTFQYFEYVGTTGLTAIGNVTGHRYRFAGDVRHLTSLVGHLNTDQARL